MSSPATPDGEARARRTTTRRYERFFGRGAAMGVLITAAGIVLAFFLHDGARAVALGALGVGGLWLSAMALVIKQRIRTGPKAEYLRDSRRG